MSEEEEYEVEDIVGEKVDKTGEILYQVRWKGVGEEYDTFEPFDNLAGCPEILNRYFDRKKQEEEKQLEKKKSRSTENKKKDTKESKKKHKNKTNKQDIIPNASKYFSDELSDSPPPPPPTDINLSKEKKKKKEKEIVKPSKSITKRKTPQHIKIDDDEEDSGNIFTDFSSNSSQTEETKKDIIIKTPSFTTNIVDNKIKETNSKNKEKSKKKDEKPTEKVNKKEKTDKSTKKIEKNSPKNESPKTKKKTDSKSDKKPSKKSENSTSEKSKSDSKKRSSNKSNKSDKNGLPFDLFLSDENDDDEKKCQKKQNASITYSEEHHLVLNPLPIVALKGKIEENGIVLIECQIPDRIETEKIPISLVKILQPKMLKNFEESNA
ncbi:hypothetical protein M9Y10_040331 [Tritrichomonas musculus]|uniref:Chromo domain-containing protein n=1 Tax=Tritrichomonas musculus TaxID=1915356 RepID=A0ABR2GPS5_9EUKA